MGLIAAELPVLSKKLRRRDMVAFFAKLEPTEWIAFATIS
jgi:hypothetical protein